MFFWLRGSWTVILGPLVSSVSQVSRPGIRLEGHFHCEHKPSHDINWLCIKQHFMGYVYPMDHPHKMLAVLVTSHFWCLISAWPWSCNNFERNSALFEIHNRQLLKISGCTVDDDNCTYIIYSTFQFQSRINNIAYWHSFSKPALEQWPDGPDGPDGPDVCAFICNTMM